MTTWHEDILGVGFSYTTLELHPDEQGEAYATLIRYLPQEDQEAGERPDPAFAFIAIHGWNDYFYQTELARTITSLGGQFYAIDLRRYGRSHREGQLWGTWMIFLRTMRICMRLWISFLIRMGIRFRW
ncbi:hypothetical protein [Arcanobacterium haemolyticum]|uniref:hypothetical protein n=1 Tax=Arcanobacterium haemolyticum TaxID=28264 RepID=UPI0021AC5F7B|nr:hypothetical protein [Arcanobacterium haemolyticum]